MQASIRQWVKYIAPIILVVLILYISLQEGGYQQIYTHFAWNNTLPRHSIKQESEIPVEPVNIEDWNANLPKYKDVPENVTKTDWWKSAAFIQWDLETRPFEYRCKRLKVVGNWWICLDREYMFRPPCLVYSFGIGFDFSFDDDMAKYGCEVHAFDPSMKMKEHIRNTSVHFHPIGLSHVDTTQFVPRKDMYVIEDSTWPVMTIHSIMKLLGHTGRHLDVLKMDVEGYEWNILDYLLKTNFFTNVNQFMLEYHLFPTWPSRAEYPKFLKLYKTLHDNGFRKFVTALHPLNHNPNKFNIQADVAYINQNYIPKKR